MSSDKTRSFKMLSLDVIIIALLIWALQRTNGLEVCSQSGKHCSANTNDHSEFIGRYTFPTTPIKTFECKSEEAIAEMKKGVCCFLRHLFTKLRQVGGPNPTYIRCDIKVINESAQVRGY